MVHAGDTEVTQNLGNSWLSRIPRLKPQSLALKPHKAVTGLGTLPGRLGTLPGRLGTLPYGAVALGAPVQSPVKTKPANGVGGHPCKVP